MSKTKLRTPRKPKKVKDEIPPFLWKTYEMLEDEQNYNYIRWKESGQSFCIVDGDEFATLILPRYFKHNNLCSFIRQLHTYGFRKVDRDPKALEFKHSKFQRNQKHLLKEIKRRASVKRTFTETSFSNEIPPESQSMRAQIQKLQDDKSRLLERLEQLERSHMETQEMLAMQMKQMQLSNMKLHQREEKLLQLLLQQQAGPGRGGGSNTAVVDKSSLLANLDNTLEEEQACKPSSISPILDLSEASLSAAPHQQHHHHSHHHHQQHHSHHHHSHHSAQDGSNGLLVSPEAAAAAVLNNVDVDAATQALMKVDPCFSSPESTPAPQQPSANFNVNKFLNTDPMLSGPADSAVEQYLFEHPTSTTPFENGPFNVQSFHFS